MQICFKSENVPLTLQFLSFPDVIPSKAEEIEETVRKAQEKAEWSAFDFSSKVLAVNYALETATFQKLDFEAGCASVTISSEKRLLLKKEVQDYADYLIRKLIEEALKNGSDREAKE